MRRVSGVGRGAVAVASLAAFGARAATSVPNGRASVHVTDAEGHPLLGASVRFTPQPVPTAASRAPGSAPNEGASAVPNVVPNGVRDTVVTTDAAGLAAVGGLAPGVYRVRVSHPAIVRAGVEPPSVDLVVGSDALAPGAAATVAPPSLARLVARCGPGQLADTIGSRLVYGTVVDATSARADGVGAAPVAGARVTVAWTVFEGGRSVRRATTDAGGTFVVCGIPDVATPSVGAEGAAGRLVAPVGGVSLGTWRAAFVPLELRPPPADATPTTLVMTGKVIDSVTGAPLPGALVQMIAAGQPTGRIYAVTADSAGVFAIPDLVSGRYVLRFEHPTVARYDVDLPDYVTDLPPGWREALITLAGPTPAQVLARTCPQAGDTVGLLLGRLRAAGDPQPEPGGHIRVSWGRGARVVADTIGGDGVFRVCGVPRAVRVTVTVDPPAGWQHAALDLLTARRGVTATDVVVRRARSDRAASDGP